jgi:hypothetical protein
MGGVQRDNESARERADVVSELVKVVTRLEAARGLVPPHEREIAQLGHRRLELLDELLQLDAARLAT